MPVAGIQQKITQLTELLNNPKSNEEGSILRVYYELFQLSNEGRDLPLETLKWLNETASLFLSAQLVNILTELHLHVYGFKFAALNFIDVDDVIYDLCNGEILKSVHSLPPGAFNKLKRQLLEPPPPPPRSCSQQQPQSQPTVENTPHQQPSRRNYFAAPSSTCSSASSRGNDSDQRVEFVDPYARLVRKTGWLKRSEAFSKMKRDASAAGPAVPLVNPPLIAPTGNRPQAYGHPPIYEPPSQPTQHPQTGTSPLAPGYSNYPSGMVPHRDGAPVCPPPGAHRRSTANAGSGLSAPDDNQINLQDQTNPSSLVETDQQISTSSLLGNIPMPQYLSVSNLTEGEDVLFDQHCKLYRFDGGISKEHGVGQLKLLRVPSTKEVRLLMRRDKVLEVCADHLITIDLKLLGVSNKNWCIWSAVDYADDEKGKLNKFAARFQTEEQSVEFRKAFEGAQSTLEKVAQQSLGNTFAPKSGSPSCLNNKAEAANCVSLDRVKPVAVIPVSSAPTMNSTAPTIAGLLFSVLPQKEPTPLTTELTGTGAAALASNPKPAKDSKRKQADKFHPTSPVVPATKGLTGSGGFNFAMNSGATAANLNKSESSATVSVGSEEENCSEPVSPMPEDEEMVYRQHAELCRFTNGEWKQKKAGDVNILRHKSTGKTRFLMTSDQTLDICLNHVITSALSFQPKDDKSWLWTARDFSDGQGKIETFMIRFRDAETSEAFMTFVREILNGGTALSGDKSKEKVDCIPDDDEKGVTNPASSPVSATNGENLSGAMKATNSSSGNTPFLRPNTAGFSFGSSASFPAFGYNLKSAIPTFSGADTKEIFQQSTARNSQDSRRTITAKRSKTPSAAINPPATESTSPSKKVVEEGKETVLYEKSCSLDILEEASTEKNWIFLGTSNIRIVFNAKMNCYRIIAQDGNQQCLCDTVISMETELKVDGTMCTWSAFDYSKKESAHRTFLAHFNRETKSISITDAAIKFKSVFAKGKRFAGKSNIRDPSNFEVAGYDCSTPS